MKIRVHMVYSESPPDFSASTKEEALKRAGNSCECERTGCHTDNEIIRWITEVLSDPMRP